MATVTFSNGIKVNFNGTPTPKDIEEVAKKLGIQQNQNNAIGEAITKPKTKAGKVLKFTSDIFTGFTKQFGSSIGQTAAAGYVRKKLDAGEQSKQTAITNTIEQIKKARAAGRDTSRLQKALNDLQGVSSQDTASAIPVINKTDNQILGEGLGMAAEMLSFGALKGIKGMGLTKNLAKTAEEAVAARKAFLAKKTAARIGEKLLGQAKNAATILPIGYAQDVASGLTGARGEDRQGASAFIPGLGTALSVAIPAAVGATQAAREGLRAGAPKVINSLIKPLAKDFAYGKNPGRAVAQEGIKANSFEELETAIRSRREKVGQSIGKISSSLEGKSKIQVESSLSALDDAMQEAATSNNPTLLKRLENVKKSIVEEMVLGVDETGNATIVSNGKRKLNDLQFKEAREILTTIGKMTAWTGNPSDDKTVNAALKKVYGMIKDTTLKAADDVDPVVGKEFRKLTEKYADLHSAEIATKYRDAITKRQNIMSMPATVGTAAGVITAIATGGAAVPALLAGAGVAALDKVFASVAVKTRVASWLAGASMPAVTKVLNKNPKLRSFLFKLIKDENLSVDEKVKAFLKNPKAGLSIEDVTKRPKEFNVGISSVKGRLKMPIDEQVEQAEKAYAAGNSTEAKQIYDQALAAGEEKIKNAFRGTGIDIKLKKGFGLFGGQLEPNHDLTAIVPKGKEDFFHYQLAKLADDNFNQYSVLTYSPVTDVKQYGMVDAKKGIVHEPLIRIKLKEGADLSNVQEIHKLVEDAGFYGASYKDNGKTIDLLHITKFDPANEYEKFQQQAEKLTQSLDAKGLYGGIESSSAETRLIGHGEGDAYRTYGDYQREFLEENKNFFDTKEGLSTKILDRLGNKPTTSKEEILNFAKSPDVSQMERNMAEEIVGSYKESKFPSSQYAKDIRSKIIPLSVEESDKYANYGLDAVGLGYGADAKTLIFSTPVEHGKTGHFNNPGLFGHSRVAIKEEGGKKIGYITEVQSDLFQHDLPASINNAKAALSSLEAELSVSKNHLRRLDVDTEDIPNRMERMKVVKERIKSIEDSIEGWKITEKSQSKTDYKSQLVALQKNEKYRTRLMDETLEKLRQDGVEEVRVATPSSAAKIEGFAGEGNTAPYTWRNGDRIPADVDLTHGDEVDFMGEDYLVVDTPVQGRGWGGTAPRGVTLAPADKVNSFTLSDFIDEEVSNSISETQSALADAFEKGITVKRAEKMLLEGNQDWLTDKVLQKIVDGGKKVSSWDDIADDAEEIFREYHSENAGQSLRDIYGNDNDDNIFFHEHRRYDEKVYVVEDGAQIEQLEQPSAYDSFDESDLENLDDDKDFMKQMDLSESQETVLKNYYSLKEEYLEKLSKENNIKIEKVDGNNGSTWWSFPLKKLKKNAFAVAGVGVTGMSIKEQDGKR